MKYQTGIKTLLIFTAFTFALALFGTKALASDYKYKVLDPRYNPSAEQIAERNIPPVQEVLPDEEKKGFDFLRFLSIIALISFPAFIITLSVKAFKEITEDIPGRISEENKPEKEKEQQTLGNIKIQPKPKAEKDFSLEDLADTEDIENINFDNLKIMPDKRIDEKAQNMPVSIKQMMENTDEKYKHTTSPLHKKNPMLLNTAPLTKNKGLCLVEYNQKYSLIGYINNEIFLLNQFDYVNSNEIRSRLSEKVDNKDRYIVRLGDYKALVEVSDKDMSLLLEL